MKKKTAILALAVSLLCTGCSFSIPGTGGSDSEPEEEVSENSVYSFDITDEQFDGIKVSQDTEFLKKNMTDNTYYVEHNGYYYPLASYKAMVDGVADDYNNAVKKTDTIVFSSDNENEIPTLFEGDRLIYYSTSSLLKYTLYYRMMDSGYTIGLCHLESDIGGNVYFDLKNDTDITIMPETDMYELYNQKEADQVLLDKISGQKITGNMLTNGTIRGLKKDATYDLDLYLGTYFAHYSTPASYHLFTGFEKFATSNYTPLQEYVYEVEIPDYLVNGYYTIAGGPMFRLVRGKSYNTDTFFNEQLLFLPDEDAQGKPIKEESKLYKTYSENPELNKFQTSVPGVLGYVDPDAVIEEQEEEPEQILDIQSTIMKTFELWLPEGDCEVVVTSPSEERTGNIVISFEDGTNKTAEYNYIEKNYSLEMNGRNEKATLSINGFLKDYDIKLNGCQQYKEQDIELQKQAEAQAEEKQQSESVITKAKEWIKDVLYLNGQKD